MSNIAQNRSLEHLEVLIKTIYQNDINISKRYIKVIYKYIKLIYLKLYFKYIKRIYYIEMI